MKKLTISLYFAFICLTGILVSCNKSGKPKEIKETIIKGSTSILVDETLQPVMEDQIAVFESIYPATITMVSKSEKEVVRSLMSDSLSIAILSRRLTIDEDRVFKEKKIIPKVTPFATDGIALIANQKRKDTVIALNDIVSFLQGNSQKTIKGLVFDNPNSSTVRFMSELAGVPELPQNGIFSFKTNEEVIKYVSENEGMIGVVGLNWLYQPSGIMKSIVKKVNVLSVKNVNGTEFYEPSQNNIAEGTYPLARDLYIINCQGSSGLGMGFASFIAGDRGQRIILKSGLLPVRTPNRLIQVKNKDNVKN